MSYFVKGISNRPQNDLTMSHNFMLFLKILFRVKRKVEEYEYDEAMEPSYRKSLFKMFNKTLDEGFFPMVIVDAMNHKVRWRMYCNKSLHSPLKVLTLYLVLQVCHFDRFWSNAKMKGFEVS